jgi:Zn-dependent protease with chaperone function
METCPLRHAFFLCAGLALAACVPVAGPVPPTAVLEKQPGGFEPPPPGPVFATSPQQAISTFIAVVEQVEPVAEQMCRARAPFGVNCDLQIVVDSRPGVPPNAFQTVDQRGRPVVGFTIALIADARNADEIAFVMGHEAAHHIAGHIPKREETAIAGALVAGVLAQASGADSEAVRAAQDLGAQVGARSYSREFELEADALGAEIAFRAGFDPVTGSGFFDRLPDPGDQFLGTHPPNAQRKQIVRDVTAQLRAGG